MTTTEQQTETILFPRLFKAIKKEHEQRLAKFIEEIKTVEDKDKLTAPYSYYGELIPKGKNVKTWTVEELKAYLIERRQKKTEKQIQKDLVRLLTIERSGDFISAKISVEWKRSQMWGSNPTGHASVHTSTGYAGYESGSIGGCGYDKLSTAVANCLNQSNELLKAMYLLKERKPTVKNHELFGYGSGYGILPSLEGGVGVSCYPTIFKKLGFQFSTIASGKTFDVFQITKL